MHVWVISFKKILLFSSSLILPIPNFSLVFFAMYPSICLLVRLTFYYFTAIWAFITWSASNTPHHPTPHHTTPHHTTQLYTTSLCSTSLNFTSLYFTSLHHNLLLLLLLLGNRIKRMANLSCLRSLTELNMRRNCIESIHEIETLPALERLFLSHNSISW